MSNWQLDVQSEEDLQPPGAERGTVPTDIEQATGLERLEILGKMQGIDIFDMKPLDASRRGESFTILSSHAASFLPSSLLPPPPSFSVKILVTNDNKQERYKTPSVSNPQETNSTQDALGFPQIPT